MNGYLSQRKLHATALIETQTMTSTVWAKRYRPVPRNRATDSAKRAKASVS